MTSTLGLSTSPESFRENVRDMADHEGRFPQVDEAIRLCHLGGGVLEFAETIFPEVRLADIKAELYDREPKGRGAHFDVYDERLYEAFPYIGVFNLAGEVEVTAAKLPDNLAKMYYDSFPEPNDAAFQARRDFSSIALNMEGVEIYKGLMAAGSGMVLLQKKDGPHIVHNVVPKDPANPGKFIKLVVTDQSPETQEAIANTSLQPLDQILSSAIGLELVDETSDSPELPLERVLEDHLSPRRKPPCNFD